MYATRARRTKTDRRDARTLMEAFRFGAYRVAHRPSDARRHVRAELAVREAVVRTRTRYIALAKALVRHGGLRVPASESHLVAARIAALEVSVSLAVELPRRHRLTDVGSTSALRQRQVHWALDAGRRFTEAAGEYNKSAAAGRAIQKIPRQLQRSLGGRRIEFGWRATVSGYGDRQERAGCSSRSHLGERCVYVWGNMQTWK